MVSDSRDTINRNDPPELLRFYAFIFITSPSSLREPACCTLVAALSENAVAAKDNVEYGLSLLRIWLRSPGCRTMAECSAYYSMQNHKGPHHELHPKSWIDVQLCGVSSASTHPSNRLLKRRAGMLSQLIKNDLRPGLLRDIDFGNMRSEIRRRV